MNSSWTKCKDLYPVVFGFRGKAIAKPERSRFCRRVRRQIRPGNQSRDTRYIDDSASPSFNHARQHRASAMKWPAQIDFDGPPPLGGINLPRWANGAKYSGIIDQQFDGTELEFGTFNGGIYV